WFYLPSAAPVVAVGKGGSSERRQSACPGAAKYPRRREFRSRGSRRLHCGQSRREGPRTASGARRSRAGARQKMGGGVPERSPEGLGYAMAATSCGRSLFPFPRMAMTPGAKFGPYEILSPLGAGGMGQVFRARDERLKRDVAIKFLSPKLALDAEALRRLEQEARAIAALNHPNLLTIHDVGAAPDGAPFLVCELLEGESLRARLATGALPVRQALVYAAQLAHGLAAAHAKGIIHRDLKPENIFCTGDGRVKILDFGLAKFSPAALGDDRTLPAGGETAAGVVLGTVSYMSPEQARGQAADARSDVFSLGAVIYEMLSGRRAFGRDTAADTISAILREEPAELELANSALAAPIERILRHCLEKQPARRFQAAEDLAFALEGVNEAHSTTSLQAAAPAGPNRRRWLFAAVGTLGLIAAAAA